MALEFNIDEKGIFIKEIKNRFRSEVMINNKIEMCYIQSSSRLDNYVTLSRKTVYLKKIENPNKLKYSVMAIRYYYDYILLCPMLANQIVFSDLNKRFFCKLGNRHDAILEYIVDNYKSDIYLPETDNCIEVKAFISDKIDNNIFPSVYSERTIEQLKYFIERLSNNMLATFIIVSFNPYIDKLFIDTNTEFYKYLRIAIDNGLILLAFSISCKENIHIKKEIKIIYK